MSEPGGIAINGSCMPAHSSHWAFGKLCSTVEAPASYLRTLHAEMAKDCLQYGPMSSEQRCTLLLREQPGNDQSDPAHLAATFTGEYYVRIWDAGVVRYVMNAVKNSPWHVPPARESNNSVNNGLYASDHDMFAFLVSDENPVQVGSAKLGKGFSCKNSETGASTFSLTTFLYNIVGLHTKSPNR